jgi:hypothetical protein
MKYLLITIMLLGLGCKKDIEQPATVQKQLVQVKIVTVGGTWLTINGLSRLKSNQTYDVMMYRGDTVKYSAIGGNPDIETDIIQDTIITRYKGYKTLDIKYIVK